MAWLAALLLGVVLRAVPLAAARPYIAYVDEGNFLHAAFRLVRDGGWDPREYLYPQFPRLAVIASARALDAVVRLAGGGSLRERIPPEGESYDELEPFAFLVLARCLSLAAGIGVIIATGLLAERVAGKEAGAAAALLAALTPALVLRGSIASVDSYATLAVIGCAYATDRTRDARRPALASFAAGALAGVAFASKYPAGLVILAFGVTTIFQPIESAERLRRLVAATAGLVLGAVAAMPALLSRAGGVVDALRVQKLWYGQLATEQPLWRQAFVEAEATLGYRHPEVGVGFALLVMFGILLGLRNHKIAATVSGWCAYAGACFLLFGTRVFHPFRNLMPLVPLGCVAAAIAFLWIREALGRRAWINAIAVAWLFAAFALPLASHAIVRQALEDPRKLAVDWLAAQVRPGDEIVFVRELGFLNQEIERVAARRSKSWWSEVGARIQSAKPRFVVAGILARPSGPALDTATSPELDGYEPRFRAGKKPTMPLLEWWRGNDQLVIVFERKHSG